MVKDERNLVLIKLQDMCKTVFMNSQEAVSSSGSPQKPQVVEQDQVPKILQFGSLVSGLAMESSDMDMAVTNLFLPDREKMIASLDIFAENLQQWEMIKDLNAISTASIPVIKASVDLTKLREQSQSIKMEEVKETRHDFGQTQADVSAE